MDYTRAEIIIECKNHLKKISKKSKKRLREDIDKRNYLISLLYFKFKLTEETISNFLDLNRNTITQAKWQAPFFISIDDISFIANVNEYLIKYPFEFPTKEQVSMSRILKKKTSVTVNLHLNVYNKLKNYAEINDLRSDKAAADLLTKALKIWVE